MELIIKDASQSSRIPLREKEAAMGMVPYIHRGEAMPIALATTIPNTPSLRSPRERRLLWIASLAKTEMADPSTMPSTQ